MHYRARPAWRNPWRQIAAAAVLPIVFVLALLRGERFFTPAALPAVLVVLGLLFVYLLVVVAYRRYSWRYLIDADAIESHQGLIGRTVRSIRVQDLRNVNLRQSVVQRLLGVGDVEFSSAGGGGVEVVFFGVRDPVQVKALVQRLQGQHAPSVSR